MDISSTEIVVIMGGIVALFKLLEKGIDILSKQFNKGKIDNQQCIDIGIINNQLLNYEKNHFPTIDKKFEINAQDHKEIMKIITKIAIKLGVEI